MGVDEQEANDSKLIDRLRALLQAWEELKATERDLLAEARDLLDDFCHYDDCSVTATGGYDVEYSSESS